MTTQKINKVLDKIESWMKMTCEGCAMPEKLNPLIAEIRKLLEDGNNSSSADKQ